MLSRHQPLPYLSPLRLHKFKEIMCVLGALLQAYLLTMAITSMTLPTVSSDIVQVQRKEYPLKPFEEDQGVNDAASYRTSIIVEDNKSSQPTIVPNVDLSVISTGIQASGTLPQAEQNNDTAALIDTLPVLLKIERTVTTKQFSSSHAKDEEMALEMANNSIPLKLRSGTIEVLVESVPTTPGLQMEELDLKEPEDHHLTGRIASWRGGTILVSHFLLMGRFHIPINYPFRQLHVLPNYWITPG
jgi:hypothetical protein